MYFTLNVYTVQVILLVRLKVDLGKTEQVVKLFVLYRLVGGDGKQIIQIRDPQD